MIEAVSANPFYGAYRYLRSIDPLYQAEIGVDRKWEAKFTRYESCGCNCPHCDRGDEAADYVVVVAKTAREAKELAISENGKGAFNGVRVHGVGCRFTDPDETQ